MEIPDASLSLGAAVAKPAAGRRACAHRAGSAGSGQRPGEGSPGAASHYTDLRSRYSRDRTGGRSGSAPGSARSCRAGSHPRSPPRPRPPRDWTAVASRGMKGSGLTPTLVLRRPRGPGVVRPRAFTFSAVRQTTGAGIGCVRKIARAGPCGKCGNRRRFPQPPTRTTATGSSRKPVNDSGGDRRYSTDLRGFRSLPTSRSRADTDTAGSATAVSTRPYRRSRERQECAELFVTVPPHQATVRGRSRAV